MVTGAIIELIYIQIEMKPLFSHYYRINLSIPMMMSQVNCYCHKIMDPLVSLKDTHTTSVVAEAKYNQRQGRRFR